MADRLRFKFTRIGQIGQVGECSVDVLDPTDVEEIKRKLKDQEFAEFLVLDYEFGEHQWNFEPISDDDDDQGTTLDEVS